MLGFRRSPDVVYVKRSIALLGLLLFAATPCFAQGAPGWISDGWITVKAKIALATADGVSASDVSIDTVDGRVSLYGKVPAQADKQRAEQIVKRVNGVRSVRNLLQVTAAQRARPVRSNVAIRRDVVAALHQEPRLAGADIKVGAISKGVVSLEGTARNSAEHLRAINLARQVPGVRRIISSVETPPQDADLDIWSNHELRQEGRGVLDVASDLLLTAETRLKLFADPRITEPDINIDSRDQKVTLFGIVSSAEAKRAATEDAQAVAGVRGVNNELQVVAASKRPIVNARDGELEEEVTKAIYARAEMKRAAVRAAVRNGVARLSGTAPSQQHLLYAATAARSIPGVRAVDVDIRVTSVTEEPTESFKATGLALSCPESITVKRADGQDVTVHLTSSTDFDDAEGCSELGGTEVKIKGTRQNDGSVIAGKVDVKKKPD